MMVYRLIAEINMDNVNKFEQRRHQKPFLNNNKSKQGWLSKIINVEKLCWKENGMKVK